MISATTRRLLALCLGILASTVTASPTPLNGPGYLAYGDWRGYIEPCGCDPATDMGGIKRLGVVLERERGVHQNMWLFSLGNNVPPPKETGLKTPFILEAEARLRPTAILFNQLEAGRITEIRDISGKAKLQLPYVLSNAKAKSAVTPLVLSSLTSGGVFVLGYAYAPAMHDVAEPLSQELIARWRESLKTSHGTFKVLLFAGSTDDLKTIADTKLFDAIISSNPRPIDAVPGTEERQDQGRLLRLKEASVYSVPLAGEGLLRGGSLAFDEAKPISAYLGPDHQKPETGNPFAVTMKLVTWLDPESAPVDGPLKDLYDRYTKAAREAFLGESERRAKDLKDSPFAGAAACASCHQEQTKVFNAMAHAHAMETLKNKGKDEDGECVACHAVGAKEKGGFVSMSVSPNLANVQCESCHGPRLAHTKNPKGAPKPKIVAHDMCVTCHNAQHSPNFKFETYWPKIIH